MFFCFALYVFINNKGACEIFAIININRNEAYNLVFEYENGNASNKVYCQLVSLNDRYVIDLRNLDNISQPPLPSKTKGLSLLLSVCGILWKYIELVSASSHHEDLGFSFWLRLKKKFVYVLDPVNETSCSPAFNNVHTDAINSAVAGYRMNVCTWNSTTAHSRYGRKPAEDNKSSSGITKIEMEQQSQCLLVTCRPCHPQRFQRNFGLKTERLLA
ncbi:hypothetical protein FF38_12455 [Lucilia cuprina]|uniref:Uncharacterized protein n=1 Tax=Lucilia cuprina TaxID=7375 RepID=A0A0L0CI00_LUCCU|nr:hypothetical protein FF38_12455 [Lucilia cuprina]